MINAKTCATCLSPKATLSCGLCKESLCKHCTEFVDVESFSFMANIPEELKLNHYCHHCHTDKVLPAVNQYRTVMKRAKSVFVIDKPRRRALPVIRKSDKVLQIVDCSDREETILRLAFLAAEQGYNAVVKVDVNCRKVRNGGYQKMLWQGTAFAAELNAGKLESQTSEIGPSGL